MQSKIKTYIKNKLVKLLPPQLTRTLFLPVRESGVPVTYDTAMTYSAIWRSINLISQSIACLPWSINSRTVGVDGSKTTKQLYSHHVHPLLDIAPNDEMDAVSFRETMISHALSWGNGYAEIERDGANRPMALWLIDPSRVHVSRDDHGRIIYIVRNSGGDSDAVIPAADMYHLKGLGFDGLVGYSVVSIAAKTIGLGLATERFGASFFENGAHISGVLEHPNALGDDALKHLKESLKENYSGGNSNKPMILEEGMKWNSIGVPPDDAQFLETRKFQIAEVARWFGVPLHKLNEMDKSTFSNIEHQAIEFVTDTLTPWVKRLEVEANIKLITRANRGKLYTKLNLNGLLRGDMKARGEFYKTMSNLGAYSVNEIREFEDKNGIGSDGDKRLVQLNQTTLEKIGEDDGNVPRGTMDNPPPEQRVLEETVDRVLARENHRAQAALKKHKNNTEGFFAWVDDYYSEHSNYALNQLLNVFELADLNISVDDYVSQHIEASKNEVGKWFNNAARADKSLPIQRTGKEIAAQLLGENYV